MGIALTGIVGILQWLLPTDQAHGALPVILALAIAAGLANAIVAVMQWLGRSPLDYLPEKTLREQDFKRFKLTKSPDPRVLQEQLDKARNAKEYDWAVEFGEQWVRLQPGETRAYEKLGDALIEINKLDRAREIGEQIVRLNRTEYKGYEILGEVARLEGRVDDALGNFELAYVYAEPLLKGGVGYDLANMQEAVGDIDAAIETLTQSLSMQTIESQRLFLRERIQHLEQVKSCLPVHT